MRYNRDQKAPCYNKVTIDDMFQNYLETAKNKGNSFSSIKKAEFTFNNHLKPFYADCDMVTISSNEHKALITYLREKNISGDDKNPEHLSNATINRARSLMATMYSIAVSQNNFGDAFTKNPFLSIAPMREMNLKIEYWDSETISQFLESEKGSHYYPLWVLMLNTGVRIGEAVAVHGEQIDRFADILSVDRMFCMAANKVILQTKSCRVREVGLNESVKQVLYPLLTHKGPLFTLEDGGKLRTDFVIKTIFPKACEKAGVKKMGLHGLRHTFASHYMMNGGSLYDLQKILGHSNLKTTERYAHFSRLHIKNRSNVVGFDGTGNVIKVDFKSRAA